MATHEVLSLSGLLDPADIPRLGSELIGSSEFRGSACGKTEEALEENADGLPEAKSRLCRQLRDSLNGQDGFRRKAVPILLYRYFASMRNSFRAFRGVMRSGAPFALIVGHNHTVLGGTRYDTDTPTHLAALADQTGWKVGELMPLQTNRRYGYRVGDAVRAETLVVLTNPNSPSIPTSIRPGATGTWSRFPNASGSGNKSRESAPSTWFRASPPTMEVSVSSLSSAAMPNWAGRVLALFVGSAGQNLASKQVVQGMRGAEVKIVNRKRLMHVKSHGSRNGLEVVVDLRHLLENTVEQAVPLVSESRAP